MFVHHAMFIHRTAQRVLQDPAPAVFLDTIFLMEAQLVQQVLVRLDITKIQAMFVCFVPVLVVPARQQPTAQLAVVVTISNQALHYVLNLHVLLIITLTPKMSVDHT